MYIAILGRQAGLSMAELERRFGADNTRWFSSIAATIETNDFSIEELGGTIKAGMVAHVISGGNWKQASQKIIDAYSREWSGHEGKITLGISAYGFDVPARDVQRIGIMIKKNLKKTGGSLRLIPNTDPALNTATSHHNKLGLSRNKVELLIVRSESGKIIVAESTGAQNITAIAARDQARPKRDAFVGMLPPKLARMMVTMVGLSAAKTPALDSGDKRYHAGMHNPTILDPFCGTGVILQEAWLDNFNVLGTDLSQKMVDYSSTNMQWLATRYTRNGSVTVGLGDAMTTTWQKSIDAVVSETYLGQPFSAPPSTKKLDEVRGNVNHITTAFLKNLRPQIAAGTPLCIAVPAWRDAEGRLTHLPFIRSLGELGYSQVEFTNVKPHDLIYYREDQVVARELLVLVAA